MLIPLRALGVFGRAIGQFGGQETAPTSTTCGQMGPLEPERTPSDLPKVIWVELTSKCPFDCVFCTRKRLYGAGRHMELELYRSLIRQAGSPERIRLNHSGESIHYPHLAEAIQMAKATGAITELVSALASASEATLRGVLAAGLDHLRVSLHALDPTAFERIYRFSSLEAMKNAISQFLKLRAELGRTTILDFHFVAMDRNLDQLPAVASYAASVGVRVISVLPVTERDFLDHEFRTELDGHQMTQGFRVRLREAIERAREQPGVEIQVVNPDIHGNEQLDETPRYYSGPLPCGARIAGCDENPWETTHLLANGDVMACGEHVQKPLGNLYEQTLREIWHGERYRAFRQGYVTGTNRECRTCPCKIAYRPVPLVAGLSGSAESVQFLRGWHSAEEHGARWSRQEAVLALARLRKGGSLRIQGLLPSAPAGKGNRLTVSSGGMVLGVIANSSAEMLSFDTRLSLPQPRSDALYLNFRTDTAFCPIQHGISRDTRLLGFALVRAEVCE